MTTKIIVFDTISKAGVDFLNWKLKLSFVQKNEKLGCLIPSMMEVESPKCHKVYLFRKILCNSLDRILFQ